MLMPSVVSALPSLKLSAWVAAGSWAWKMIQGATGGRWCYTRLFLPQWGVAPCEQTGVWGLAPTHGNYLRVYVRVYMCAHKALAWCKAFSALHIRKLSVGYVCASFRRFLLVLFFASLPAWARGGSG